MNFNPNLIADGIEQALRTELHAAESRVARLKAALQALAGDERPRPVRAPERRRRWTKAQKRQALVRAWGVGAVGPTAVARELGIATSHLYKWRRQARSGGV